MNARILVLLALAAVAPAQLTTDQRIADFRNLADLYANRYAMHQWKREALQVDALDIAPWLERVRNAKDDLAFYEICADYVGSLYDAHDAYFLPSTFEATLGFTVDIYDGKVLIDSVDRLQLPASAFPFVVGDELVSLDGRTPEEWIAILERYARAGNPRTARRVAAEYITSRVQTLMPHAAEIGEYAIVVVRRQNGNEEQYEVPWRKTGTPLTSLAPGNSPRSASTSRQKAAEDAMNGPEYMRPVTRLQNLRLPNPPAVLGEGALAPVFALPADFTLRLGAKPYDSFYSGTYTSGGYRIGFLRIPDFYRSTSVFEKEIQFFQQNTDGLVVDITRNPGGSACNAEELLSRLTPSFFQVTLQEVRVTWSSLLEVQYYLEEARQYGEPGEIEQMEALAKAYDFAYWENNGRTMPLPICGVSGTRAPAMDSGGNPIGYTKPLLVLTDEMTASSGDLFAAMVQDNMRGPLFGMRTMGAGGSPAVFDAGIYSEGRARVTMSQVRRKEFMATPDYPTTPYLENVGVRPDVSADYMTKENLLNKGKPFVDAFTTKIVELIRSSGGR